MGKLLLYHESDMRRRHDFADQLASEGVRLERWALQSMENVRCIGASDFLSIYQDKVDEVKALFGFENVDLVTVDSRYHRSVSLRDKHLSEHVHDEDEVRFFLSGEALLFVNVTGRVHVLHCLPGDFIVIPKGVKHWLDMGPNPNYQCIRWYDSQASLCNQLTGSYIAESTPRWEALLGRK